MQKFNVEFAKLNIEINCEYDYSKLFCKDYLTDGEPDFSVEVKSEDIDKEIADSPFNPKRGYAESICVYREIAKKLPFFDRMVFHGAVISYKGNGYIFTAPSGTGKTTHIMLWKKLVDGVDIVNGDKPIINVREDGVTAYATPYAGKEGFQNHSSADIKAICLIRRGKENKITKVKPGDYLADIIKQMYLPEDAAAVMNSLGLLDLMLKHIDVYVLECDISENAVKCSFEAMTGETFIKKEKKNEN